MTFANLHPDDTRLISAVRHRELVAAAEEYRSGRRARRAARAGFNDPPCIRDSPHSTGAVTTAGGTAG